MMFNEMMMRAKRKSLKPIVALSTVLMVGCSATTKFESAGSDVRVKIDDQTGTFIAPGGINKSGPAISSLGEHNFKTTSFGQYRFKAESDGQKTMYGNIPLKFNGGYLALDILFFAPAMLFNLREVYPHYQFELENQEVRYGSSGSDWSVYKPTPEEISEAKAALGE